MIPPVVASESGGSPNRPGCGPVGVVGLRDARKDLIGSTWKGTPQRVRAPYEKGSFWQSVS